MTRFARAKGSKASNERVPNEATPWHVMKEQLEDNTTRKNNQTPKAKSARELLKENDQPYYHDSTGNVNNEWAKFEADDTKTASVKSKKAKTQLEPALESNKTEKLCESESSGSKKLLKKLKKRDKSQIPPENGDSKETRESQVHENDSSRFRASIIDSNTNNSRKSSKKRKFAASNEIDGTEAIDDSLEPPRSENKEIGKNAELAKIEVTKSEEQLDGKLQIEKKNKDSNASGGALNGKISKRHKRNQKRIQKIAVERAAAESKNGENTEKILVTGNGGFDAAGNDWSSDVNFGKPEKICRSKNSASQDQRSAVFAGTKSPANRSNLPNFRNNEVKRKAPKNRDDKEHKRRKPDTGSIKCVINGMEVEIVKYDGFPVKKEDAERLKELRHKMIMKGIPKSEIDIAMKLERRKAEKALARVRKQVCFHCRKAGHNLSDCPELGKEESATGICFKCGSTEHTHFECKVTKKEEFRFASCFICREQGHIAKQCPDNPKGLYPQGGACKLCGDVTHLRKDCPDMTREKEETTITVGTIAENTLESLDDDSTRMIPQDDGKKTKSKIVKF